ncbi:hypothetical protein CAOG_00194 [Capsaspora owczarzaki ATCC 30864]|uniref:E2 ubiquitin-conjugating enzyme n=1 Tax=Capsaspora owczarzaki (strain ATCC 30864) TaxID=595528 RepID=A0A0D2WI44_CAPO3|nr:hypothetical protein CAOG_00194 [Capsaspora owczarzaki ATCC 30864]KJE88553.1 hypothetical protein CAOG_000194 [Capsaspora owczarzaki ATCC 30864]|eukprot:XP_004365065.1 hypothetical protein CAOG_00194 [Capsaspora owczarzaki ATCC 30864]
MQRTVRLNKELPLLASQPPPGISCWQKNPDRIDLLEANITGPEGTPYASGVFKLELEIPDRYPFEVPQTRFVTPVHHPNIDSAGRICLDLLKPYPKGSWRACHNIAMLLSSVQMLLAEPNPDDALVAEIAHQFQFNRAAFDATAKAMTLKHARSSAVSSSSSSSSSSSAAAP